MKLTPTTLALVLASAGVAAASPAYAQYGSSAPSATATPQPAANAPADAKQPKISNAVRKEIVELQTAVNAKDVANIPAKLAAAQAKAKTKEDKYVIAQLQLKAALDANDSAAMIAGLEAILASGNITSAGETAPIYNNIGKLHYNAKAHDKAAVALERVLQLDPNNIEATVLLAETRHGQGRTAEAVALIRKAIAIRTAAGQKAEEAWYKRAVSLAFNAKLPNSVEIGREWVAAYPSPTNWRDTIRIYQTTNGLDDVALLDTMRLAQATGALASENDYYRFANTLVTKGFPGEAKAVLEQGFAAKTIDRTKAPFGQLYTVASTKSQGDRDSLTASAQSALSAPAAKQAMVTADAYYGYGDYAKAAELYRAALTKSGVDKDLANLRLGMALARAGDKAGATAALGAAGGAQAEVAKLWLIYLGSKA